MTLQLFGHPFSSYTMKALIALYENETPFDFRILGPDQPENTAELARRWPVARFPLLVDGGTMVVETSAIIEHLSAFHPGPVPLIPADAKASRAGADARSRVRQPCDGPSADNRVRCAPSRGGSRSVMASSQARTALDTIYAWLDHALAGRQWAAGDAFTLADAAAAPALFYADWVQPIGENRTDAEGLSRPSAGASLVCPLRRRRPSLSAVLSARCSDRD